MKVRGNGLITFDELVACVEAGPAGSEHTSVRADWQRNQQSLPNPAQKLSPPSAPLAANQPPLCWIPEAAGKTARDTSSHRGQLTVQKIHYETDDD